MPPRKKTELENTEKRLAKTREKLARILTGQHDVRGREKKIEALQKSINDLELKISTLWDVVPSPASGQSAVSRLSTMQIIQVALGAPLTPFMPKVVKQEQLESIFVGNGPGSEQDPMQIDADVPEIESEDVPSSSHKVLDNPASLDDIVMGFLNPTSISLQSATAKPTGNSGSETIMDIDGLLHPVELAQNHTNAAGHNTTGIEETCSQKNNCNDVQMGGRETGPQTDDHNDVQDHDMGCSVAQNHTSAASLNTGIEETHSQKNRRNDVQGGRETGPQTDDLNDVRDHEMGCSVAQNHTSAARQNTGFEETCPQKNDRNDVRDHDMGCSIDATGLEAVKSVNDNGAQESDTVIGCGIKATSSNVVESNAVGCTQEDRINMPLQNITSCLERPEPFNFGHGDQDPWHGIGMSATSSQPFGPVKYYNYEPGTHNTLGPLSLATNDLINWHGEGDEGRTNEDSLQDKFASKENVGLFNNDGYGSDWVWDAKCYVNEDIYSFQLREYNPCNAPIEGLTLDIFNSESPQTSLHHRFNGNLKCTVAHVTAISWACKDIETVEAHIRDLSNHAKAKRCNYLASLTEDDQCVLIEAQEAQRDPLEIADIQTEQGLIRVSKERISLLQKAIAGRAHEMNELASVAQRLRDEGSESVSDGTMVSKRDGQKGRKKAQEIQRQLPGSIAGASIPKRLLFPSVPMVIAQASHLHMTEDPEEDCGDVLNIRKKGLALRSPGSL